MAGEVFFLDYLFPGTLQWTVRIWHERAGELAVNVQDKTDGSREAIARILRQAADLLEGEA